MKCTINCTEVQKAVWYMFEELADRFLQTELQIGYNITSSGMPSEQHNCIFFHAGIQEL
jgi:hypothetical protein